MAEDDPRWGNNFKFSQTRINEAKETLTEEHLVDLSMSQAHHIIPREIVGTNPLLTALVDRLPAEEFDPARLDLNGMFLPSDRDSMPGYALHRGPHQTYSDWVSDQVEAIGRRELGRTTATAASEEQLMTVAREVEGFTHYLARNLGPNPVDRGIILMNDDPRLDDMVGRLDPEVTEDATAKDMNDIKRALRYVNFLTDKELAAAAKTPSAGNGADARLAHDNLMMLMPASVQTPDEAVATIKHVLAAANGPDAEYVSRIEPRKGGWSKYTPKIEGTAYDRGQERPVWMEPLAQPPRGRA